MSVYRRDGLPWLSVFLRSAAGAVELSTVDDSTGYKLLDGVKGLGIPTRSVESTPIPAGHGSVFRSQRFDESEVLLPISVKGLGPDHMAELRRGLESVLLVDRDEPAELIVQAPGLGTVRRRFVYYTEGLEGALGGADSHLEWNHIALRLLALDPMWWGAEQSETFRVKPARKPFLSRMRDEPSTPTLIRTNYVLSPMSAQSWSVGSGSGAVSSAPDGGVLIESTAESPVALRAIAESSAKANARYAGRVDVVPGVGVEFVLVEVRTDGSYPISKEVAVTEGTPTTIMVEEQQARSGVRSVAVTLKGRRDGMFRLAPPAGSVTRVTGASLVLAGEDPEPFDGDSTDADLIYRWAGTPGESASEELRPASDDVQAVPFFPIMLSSSTIQGARQIDIQGDADAYPIWTVHGPGEDFEIINRTTGERFFLEGEITSPITIDSRTEQLSSDGMSNMELWARVPRELSTFPLRPGRNDISFAIVNATEQSRVELRYAEQWRAGY